MNPAEFSALNSALETSLDELIAQVGEYVQYSGVRFPAVISSIEIEAPYGNGGYNSTEGVSIALLKRDLNGARPHVGDLLIARGITFQVLKAEDNGPGYTYTAQTLTV